MSIKSFIKRVCVQDAVYWEYDGVDGYNTTQFLDPTDIKVRWDEKTEIVTDSKGKEFVSDAQILTPGDLKEQSYVMLGTVDALPAEADPLELEGAFAIKAMDRYPLFKSTTFDVFLAYLSNNG